MAGSAEKVLIANRGEIARRVIRSCRQLGLATVAVYSEADVDAAHVAEADEARAIGGARAQDSYLRVDNIIDAALATGTGLIHPGYGFLSENAGFARAATAAGLIFIGPEPDTIELMGDKQRAREAAAAAGLPIVPGSRRFETGETAGIDEAAREVGYPLLVKAAAGGGGIGMRRVDDPGKLGEVVSATQSMAQKAFGDGAVYLERLIARARHVEIQVFGDGRGGAVHLFERDCSLQRRFQKVIEESPAPGLLEQPAHRMAACAVALAATTRYAGAGTVEYILDADTHEFFFLEMNTRIQVEHAVTEMVTGTDLVAMQIELALGRLTPLRQAALRRQGHAVECRLYAENPARMFLPSPGRLARFVLPAESASVRVESGYREGDDITPWYDPLVAKIIVHAGSRAEALNAAVAAIGEVRVEGIKTNRDFLLSCLQHDAFTSGHITTGFLDQNLKELLG